MTSAFDFRSPLTSIPADAGNVLNDEDAASVHLAGIVDDDGGGDILAPLPVAAAQSGQQHYQQHSALLWMSESFNEALFLYVTASVGVLLNAAVVACIMSSKTQRRITSSFVVHGCALDAIKCAYCVPFATSLLRDVAPGFCAALGGSYVVIVTASGFNIVAMVCCEAYAFGERSTGASGSTGSAGLRQGYDSAVPETGGSVGCAVFGVLMVYIGSVIVHLGPTIIGGDFNYNDLIGNCIFVYGTIKSYVVQTMWIVIMTLAMAGAVYYLVYFDRHVRANSSHRLAALVRASVAISRGNTSIVAGERLVRAVVRRTLSRSRVLIVVTVLFIISWYPLYILTLLDPKFQQPTKIYKLLTFVAWSNPALNPVVLILFDNNIDALRRIWCCRSKDTTSSGNHRHRAKIGFTGRRHRQNGGNGSGSTNQSPMTSWRADLTSNRKHDGNNHERRATTSVTSKKSNQPEIVETSPPPTTGSSATSTPRCLGTATRTATVNTSASGTAGVAVATAFSTSKSQQRQCRPKQDNRFYQQQPQPQTIFRHQRSRSRDRDTRSTGRSPPETVYDRVGNRLWREGEQQSPINHVVQSYLPLSRTIGSLPSAAAASSAGFSRREIHCNGQPPHHYYHHHQQSYQAGYQPHQQSSRQRYCDVTMPTHRRSNSAVKGWPMVDFDAQSTSGAVTD